MQSPPATTSASSDNLAYNNGISPFLGNGIYVGGSNNTVRNNTARNNNRNGIWVTGGSNNTFEENVLEQNAQSGFYSDDVAILDAFRNNTVRQNGMDGFTVAGSLNSLFIGNNVSLNNRSGFNLTWGGEGSPSTNNTIQDNEIYSNGASGLHLLDADRTIVIRNHLYSNSIGLLYGDDLGFGNYLLNVSGLIFDSPAGVFQNFTNLSVNDTVPAFSEYSVHWASEATSPPGRASFGQKFVNISAVTGTVSIDSIAWSWADSELAGYDEARFELWGLDSSWMKMNASLDASANTISMAGLVPASIYGIFQNNDTSPPSVILNSPPADSQSNTTSVTFNFTATDDFGAVLNCSIFIDNVLNDTNDSVLNGTATVFPVSGFAQGLHSWRVECGDGNGNTGVSVTRNFTIDTTSPSVSMQRPQNQSYNVTTGLPLNFTATDNIGIGSCWYKLDGGVSTPLPSCLNTTFSAAAGTHNMTVYANDSAGNTAQASVIFTVDTTAPSITLQRPQNISYNITTGLPLNFTATDNIGIGSCWYKLDGGVSTPLPSCLNTTFSAAAGTHNMTVYANDSAGNTAQASVIFTVDTTAPSITLQRPQNISYNITTGLPLNFTATDNIGIGSCWYKLDGGVSTPLPSCLNTTFSAAAGTHNMTVYANDSAGNTAQASVIFTIDTSAPSVTLNLPPDNATLYVDSGAFNFTATDNLASTLNCTFYLAGIPDQVNASVQNGTLTDFWVFGMSGAGNWSVTCSDGVNYGSSPVRSFFVDIQAPAIGLNGPNQSAVLNSSTVAFNFTATDNHAPTLDCSIYLDSVFQDSSPSVPSGSPFVFTVSGIADGNHTWFVNCSDGGNSNASAIRTFNVTTAVPAQPDDDDDEDRPLEVSASSSCNGTIVTAESRGDSVSNVEIRVDGSLIGTTNSSGQEEFGGCGKSVEIRADKPGYSTATETVALIDCGQCEIIPPKPPENLTCDCGEAVNGACVPFQCCSDASCKGSERCDIPSGKAGGQCRPISGECGEARNHAFVQYGYECGAESGCPSCPQGERCQAHACVSNDLTGPQSGFVGENSTVRALEDGAPCALCDVVVTDPLGRNLSGKTNPDGTFTLPLALKGAYTVALLRDGIAVRSLAISALPKSEPIEPPKPPVVQTDDWSWLLWIVILLAFLMIGLIYWRRRKEKEKPRTDKTPKR